MENLIENSIKEIVKDIPKLSTLSNEYLFSLLCFKYFYNQGNLDYKDYKTVFTDGKNDGGIDLICLKEDSNDQVHLILIQSKYINDLANCQDVVDIFTKTDQTLRNFEKNKTAQYNDRLRRILKERIEDIEDLHPITDITVFIGTRLSPNRKRDIEKKIENIDSLDRYVCTVYDSDEIEKQIESIKSPKKFVSEAKITYTVHDGKIKYGPNGLLVNISANSLKSLYERFKDSGLFEQNFRYYIRNKKIDDAIRKSLEKNRNKFWFLNNGIIIGCSDFIIDGDKIKLYNFSIINGCQTTTLIGEFNGLNEGVDFSLPCKIVKSNQNKIDDEFFNTISQIAEASNSQKPISDRDLKANREELKRLKKLLADEEPKVYLIIKRGEDVKRKSTLNFWQIIHNDLLGQLILSFNLQQPGTARSGKKKIFADDNIYDKVFKRKHDSNTLKDLVKLHNYYIEFLNKRESPFLFPNQESVATNGALYVVAIIGFFIKVNRNILDFEYIKNPETWELELQKDNIYGNIFSEYKEDDFYEILYGLFSDIIQEVSNAFELKQADKKTVTNFLKHDTDYRNEILKFIISRYYQNPKRKSELDGYLKVFK